MKFGEDYKTVVMLPPSILALPLGQKFKNVQGEVGITLHASPFVEPAFCMLSTPTTIIITADS